MSHFTVLVCLKPGETLDAVMLPYHEYESTGIEQYIEFKDMTAEIEEEYHTDTVGRYRAPDGALLDAYAYNADPATHVLWRDATPEEQKIIGRSVGTGFAQGIQYRTDYSGDTRGKTLVFDPPAGYESVEVPFSEVYNTLEDFAREWHGYKTNDDGRIGRWTNPNSKWDWYEVGGRWPNVLILKEQRKRRLGPPAAPRRADSALASEVDWDAMLEGNVAKALTKYDYLHECIERRKASDPAADDPAWVQTQKTWNGDNERGELIRAAYPDPLTYYQVRAAIADAQEARQLGHLLSIDDVAKLLLPREEYIAKQQAKACTYALLYDGKWLQDGDMGWWGMDTKTTEYDYNAAWWEVVRSLPADVEVVVVDCHI